jgi:hypothetical protein
MKYKFCYRNYFNYYFSIKEKTETICIMCQYSEAAHGIA